MERSLRSAGATRAGGGEINKKKWSTDSSEKIENKSETSDRIQNLGQGSRITNERVRIREKVKRRGLGGHDFILDGNLYS